VLGHLSTYLASWYTPLPPVSLPATCLKDSVNTAAPAAALWEQYIPTGSWNRVYSSDCRYNFPELNGNANHKQYSDMYAIFANSSRTKFVNCTDVQYCVQRGKRVGTGEGYPPPPLPLPLPCLTQYCSSVNSFANFVRELLVNIDHGFRGLFLSSLLVQLYAGMTCTSEH
jgi:hypothetical protein